MLDEFRIRVREEAEDSRRPVTALAIRTTFCPLAPKPPFSR